jgi:hypothetical protein
MAEALAKEISNRVTAIPVRAPADTTLGGKK